MLYLVFDVGCLHKYDLLVDEVQRNADGSIKTAWVVNGAWNLELRCSVILAKAGQTIINRLPYRTVKEYTVRGRHEDYNTIMARARADL